MEEFKYICSNCGSLVNKPLGKEIYSGHGCLDVGCLVVIGLALLFSPLFPIGIIILIISLFIPMGNTWSKDKTICPTCKSESVVPLDSPAGKELYKKYHRED